MNDSDTMRCLQQKSAGCRFRTLGRNSVRAKTKWPLDISRSDIFFFMRPGTSVIPHVHVIFTEQSISYDSRSNLR